MPGTPLRIRRAISTDLMAARWPGCALSHAARVPPDLVHPRHEIGGHFVRLRLRLDEVGTSADLLGHGDHVKFQRVSERVGHSADVQRHIPRDRLATFDPVVVSQRFDRLNQLDGVDVVGARGSRMVAQALVVTARQRTLRIPSAAAPKMSLCRARRFGLGPPFAARALHLSA